MGLTFLKAVEQFHAKHGAAVNIPMTLERHEREHIERVVADLEVMASELESRARAQGSQHLMRLHLIIEEISETFDAIAKGDELKAFDGFIDLSYVVIGGCVTYGFPFETGFAEVHRSNMTKDVNGDKRVRVKGPNYSPPYLKGILDKHRESIAG